jgi:hypothetical protein
MPAFVLPPTGSARRRSQDQDGQNGESMIGIAATVHRSTDQPAVLVRRGRLVALSVGAFLLPWCVLLFLALPATAQARNWALAWAGLDGAEAVAALATAVLLARANTRASLTAMAGGTLLLVDAWFDMCTSAPGIEHSLAVAEAIFVELPLAAAAFWLAVALTRKSR